MNESTTSSGIPLMENTSFSIFVFMVSAAFFATRWDIMDGKARFIWNPFDLLSTAAYCAATFGAFVLAHYGYSKIAGMVYMAIGAAFVLSHDFWLNRIYATFRKRRYVLLDKYRNLD